MNGICKRTELSCVALRLVSNQVFIYNFPNEGWGDVVELGQNGWSELGMVNGWVKDNQTNLPTNLDK